VTDERLTKTVNRLKKQLADSPPSSPGQQTATLERLLLRLKTEEDAGYLKWIKARHGDQVRLVAVDDIYYFKAEDKYTVVKTGDGEYLIKISIRQLAEELDPDQFWRIHRSTIINLSWVAGVHRSLSSSRIFRKHSPSADPTPICSSKCSDKKAHSSMLKAQRKKVLKRHCGYVTIDWLLPDRQ
jgi:DNA-binding LytR/AlgR family response regulator